MDTSARQTNRHIGSQVRTLSRLFQEIPWESDVLTTTNDLASLQVPGIAEFSRRLSAYESRLFSFIDNSLEVTDTHRLLGIQLDVQPGQTSVVVKSSTNPYTSPSDYSKAQGSRMVTLLSAYKLLDLICAKAPGFQGRKAVPRKKNGDIDPKVHKLPVANTLRDWTSVLKTFHSSYSPPLQTPSEDERIACEGEHAVTVQITKASALLVSMMARNKKHKVINTIESNIVLCALAISYLLKDTSPEVTIPDLPDDIETFANMLGNSQVVDGKVIQSDDTRALIRICEEYKPSGSTPLDRLWHLTAPLACALWLSPLSIFCSRNLTSLSFQKRALITSCTALGNEKPPLIRACEDIVWGVILDIVFGRLHPSHTIATLHKNLPWSDIMQVDAMGTINSWFIGECAPENRQLTSQPSSSLYAQQQKKTQPSSDAQEGPSTVPLPVPPQTQGLGLNIPTDSDDAMDTTDNDPIRKSNRIVTKTKPSNKANLRPTLRARKGKAKRVAVSRSSVDESDDGESAVISTRNHPVDVDAFIASRDPASSIAPIGLHKMKAQMLDLDVPTTRISECSLEPLVGYDIDGGSHTIALPFHFDDYETRLHSIFTRANRIYTAGRPPHLSDARSSVFFRMSYEDFVTKRPSDLQDVLKNKCIVITGWGTKRTGFDAENLQEIVSLFRPLSIQDYSLTVKQDADDGSEICGPSIPETVQGTMQQLLDNSALGERGRVLNALDLPCPQALSTPPSLASDFLAWEATTNAHGLSDFIAYPNGDVSWYLAGLKGALTFFHLDSDGFCTGLNVEYGKKLWGIMVPKSPIGHYDTSTLTKDGFNIDEMVDGDQDYDVELVVLRQQDGIIMGPNTLHLAGTLDHAICRGFHFYSPKTLLRTTAGLINTFILSDFLSNTHHNTSRAILLRMLSFNFAAHFERQFGDSEYYQSHLLDIKTWRGLASLMSLCNLAILVNVLDFRTYLGPNQVENDHPTERQLHDLMVDDANNIIWPERMTMCHSRGMARSVLEAITECCVIGKSGTHRLLLDLPIRHLARQMVAIAEFKENAVAAGLEGAPHCTPALLQRQLENVADWHPALGNLYHDPAVIDLDCSEISFTGDEEYQVEWTMEPSIWLKENVSDFMEEGYTPFDCKFFTRGADDERPRKRVKTTF